MTEHKGLVDRLLTCDAQDNWGKANYNMTEAARVIEEQAAEIARLREALSQLDDAAAKVLRSLPAQTQTPLLEGALFIEARRKARALTHPPETGS